MHDVPYFSQTHFKFVFDFYYILVVYYHEVLSLIFALKSVSVLKSQKVCDGNLCVV